MFSTFLLQEELNTAKQAIADAREEIRLMAEKEKEKKEEMIAFDSTKSKLMHEVKISKQNAKHNERVAIDTSTLLNFCVIIDLKYSRLINIILL